MRALAAVLALVVLPFGGGKPNTPLAAVLDTLARDPNGVALTAADVHRGAQTVPTGARIAGSFASWHGSLDVLGTVNGNAVAIDGNVTLHRGAVVHGDVVAVGGQVRNEGAIVDGEMRSISALSLGALHGTSVLTPTQRVRRALSLSVGWYLVMAIIGLGVVLLAPAKVDAIAGVLRADFSRALVAGILGEFAIVPALVLGVVALAITIIGILAIPFVVVGFILALAGALALGYIVMAGMVGEWVLRRRDMLPGGRAPVQSLIAGLTLFLFLWALGSLGSLGGLAGEMLRLLVATLTWAAVTVGFGATLLSRGGTRLPSSAGAAHLPVEDDYDWLTPTPVTGVAAARRPTPVSGPRHRSGL